MSEQPPRVIPEDDPLASEVVAVIRAGDVEALQAMLDQVPGLARARIRAACWDERTLLHIATDWPGHFPNGAATVRALVAAGADVHAKFHGSPAETPLHWAASTDDVEVIDALLEAGADIEAAGASGGATPLGNARRFGLWAAAHRLIERGAHVTLADAATLGSMEHLESLFRGPPPRREEIDHAFWGACDGAQQEAAEYLLARGADLDWLPPWERVTPLDAASRREAHALVLWLRSLGARSATESR